MKAIIELLKIKWVIELIGILALSVLIWFVGPLIAIAGSVLLESAMSRLFLVLGIFGCWGLILLLRYFLSKRRNNQLIADLSAEQGATPESAVAAELNILKRGFEEALNQLKLSAGKKGKNQQYLYELPWYVIIGAPGCGKTTALINSGLRFPLAEKLGKFAVKGVSGTRDCDWWFSDEAVLLDTAGRYLTQDSHQEVDASAWEGFLQLLKKYRPRRPLNGIFVAISIADLMQQSEEQQRHHAAIMRKRIMELNSQLGVQLPVYLLVTKTDLLSGFIDFFANLTEDERAQVWGHTFASWEDVDLTQNLATFEREFDELVNRLTQRRLKRMQEERDALRRALLFDFPTQLALAKTAISGFLSMVFSVNRYEEPLLLRGVYFTSGTQEGTPIDRVMSALAASYRIDRQVLAFKTGQGKSYFLQKLLKQVIFPEAELVGVNQKIERRYRLMSMGAYFGAAAGVALMLVFWFVSYSSNKSALANVEKQIEIYRNSNSPLSLDTQSNLLALLPRLNALTSAKQEFQQTGWYAGFGLYQGDKIDAGIDVAYQNLLRGSFTNLLVQRLKERMQTSEGDNLDVLYQLLRVYLMFSDPGRMDAKVALPWIKLDWERSFATDPEVQAKLQTHLDNLLALSLDPLTVDQNFVNSVRYKLSQVPLANQVYARFKSEALFDREHNLNLAEQMTPNGSRVYMTTDGKELNSVEIPGLFTAYGYTELFLKKGMQYVKQANEQNWVLGTKAVDSVSELDRLYGDFKRLYLADYRKQWENVINSVRLKPQPSNNQLIDSLDLLSRPDSPLKLFLETIEKNTSLSRLSADLANSLSKGVGAAVAAATPDIATQKLLDMAKTQGQGGTDPVKELESAFESYNQQVRGAADRPAPISATLLSLKNLHDYLMQTGAAPNKSGNVLPGGGINPIQAAKMEFARLPGPVAASLSNLTNAGETGLKMGAKSQLNDMLKTSVSLPCNTVLAGRYPFTKNAAQDVLMSDFAKLFAANGIMDQFFNANLRPFVDTTVLQWREMSSDTSLGLAPATIKQFQIAAKIRDAFFPMGGAVPQVQFELKPMALDEKVGTFRLNIEGQELIYRHGPEQISKFQWPGANTNAGVRFVFETLDGKQLSRYKEGSWALFRMLDEFNIERTELPDRFNLLIQIEGYTAKFELRATSVNNPFQLNEYQTFHCPESL